MRQGYKRGKAWHEVLQSFGNEEESSAKHVQDLMGKLSIFESFVVLFPGMEVFVGVIHRLPCSTSEIC